jgi:hypothetical protein
MLRALMESFHSRTVDGIEVTLEVDAQGTLRVNAARVDAIIFGQTSVIVICTPLRYVLPLSVYHHWLRLSTSGR